jgi:hypothetical protein
MTRTGCDPGDAAGCGTSTKASNKGVAVVGGGAVAAMAIRGGSLLAESVARRRTADKAAARTTATATQ